MDWVADDIAVGSFRDASDFAALQEAGVEAILQLYWHAHERCDFPLPVDVLPLLVEDRAPLVDEALSEGVGFITAQRQAGRRVLVTCGAGRSRSPSFVAAYLHEQGMDLTEAFAQIARRRPETRPHRKLVQSLIAHYELDLEASDLLAALARLRRAGPLQASYLP